jgi:hypothetical protein
MDAEQRPGPWQVSCPAQQNHLATSDDSRMTDRIRRKFMKPVRLVTLE